MPCDSSVTKTKMTNEERLGAALTALGYTNVSVGTRGVSGYKGGAVATFYRGRQEDAFLSATYEPDVINSIQRKYSEIGVREWAKRRGFSVAATEGNKLTLVNRRG